jgi:hypothetical protein
MLSIGFSNLKADIPVGTALQGATLASGLGDIQRALLAAYLQDVTKQVYLRGEHAITYQNGRNPYSARNRHRRAGRSGDAELPEK